MLGITTPPRSVVTSRYISAAQRPGPMAVTVAHSSPRLPTPSSRLAQVTFAQRLRNRTSIAGRACTQVIAVRLWARHITRGAWNSKLLLRPRLQPGAAVSQEVQRHHPITERITHVLCSSSDFTPNIFPRKADWLLRSFQHLSRE